MMPDKLDNKIKDSLRDTEMPFDPSGWDRLERDLDARGAKTSFKFNVNWKYSLNTLLVVAAASGLVFGIVALSKGISSWTEETNEPTPTPVTTSVPVVTKNELKTPVSPTASTPENKEVVVQQFFPTQVYNIQYPIYSTGYNAQKNDQVAFENPEVIDGEFSDLVKNRPVLMNPLVRPYMLGESTAPGADPANGLKTAGNEMKLSPEEMRLFKDITLTGGRGDLIFGDQIDPRKGIISKSKEGDSVKTFFFNQDQPSILAPQNNTDSTLNKKIAPK